ncbi:MAG: hypothetical protein OXF56_25065 [Rhodobacteraceae bacterium]|nr:hypothetical protein [Paracoccaceae bacterium]
MRRGKLHGVRAFRRLPNVLQPLMDLVSDVFGNRYELAAAVRESDRPAVSIKQGDANPFFKQPDPAAECRLRHVPAMGGPGKTACLCQRKEIFEPSDPHCRTTFSQFHEIHRVPMIRRNHDNRNRVLIGLDNIKFGMAHSDRQSRNRMNIARFENCDQSQLQLVSQKQKIKDHLEDVATPYYKKIA